MKRFNLKKINKVECKERHLVEVSNRLTALEELDAEVDSNSPLERM
jgi:hypothetical protein